MKKVYVVTGANGFLGNNIVRKLLLQGEQVRALVLPNDKVNSLEGLPCEIFHGDVTDLQSLQPIFEKDEGDSLVVIHCAAVVYIKKKFNPAVVKVNVDGTSNIVEMCLKTNARLVYVNSVHALPEPSDDSAIVEIDHFDAFQVEGLYAKSKAYAAQLVLDAVKNRGLNATIVHPSGIIGPGDFGHTHLTNMVEQVANGKLRMVVNGGYDFVDVRDVADGTIAAVEKGAVGQCYILSNKFFSVKHLADLVCEKTNRRKTSVVSMAMAKAFAPLCELHYTLRRKTPLFTRYSLYTLQAKSLFSHQKATEQLGYNPRPMQQTISDTVEWLAAVRGSVARKKRRKVTN